MRWRTKRGERFWAASTRRSRVFFTLAVFCTFAGLGVLFDVPRATHPPLWMLALYLGMFGTVAVTYGLGLLWDLRLLPLAVAFQVAMTLLATWATRSDCRQPLSAAAKHKRLVIDADI